jgi:5'-AMP-activated protein kinase catalytic alpha subunit
VAEHTLTQERVAVKILNRKEMKDHHMTRKVNREIRIMKMFHHPHIIRLYCLLSYEVFESATNIYIVLEYIPGGELYNSIERKGRFQESEARCYFQQIISAVGYCHSHKVSHRDIKPENILLDEQNNIKLGDFGLSNVMQDGHFFNTSCGSPNYAAPEVISGTSYCGPEADVWSCGVVLYALLAGALPFDDANMSVLFSKIKAAQCNLPHFFSDAVKDLIYRILNPDPISRITISEIERHPWYATSVPIYLRISESAEEDEAHSSCLSEIRATKSHHELDEALFAVCLKLPAFEDIITDPEELKATIIERKGGDFAVSYELLHDSKLKSKRDRMQQQSTQVPRPIFKPATGRRDSVSPFSSSAGKNLDRITDYPHDYTQPNDWVFGFRPLIDAYSLMVLMYDGFRAMNLEWKIYTNFQLRVKSVKVEGRYEKGVKFDVSVFKHEGLFVIDARLLAGQAMIFMDLCARLQMHFLEKSIPHASEDRK